MSRLKSAALLFSLLTLTACNDANKVTGGAGSDSNSPVSSETSGNAPQNGLTFANNEASSAAPRSGLDQHLNSGLETTFDQLQDDIFTAKCAQCHTGGDTTLPGSMNFSSADATYASLVDAPSTEYPQLSLVASGMSTNSYLVRKIEGTQLVGKQMPLQGGHLSNDDIRRVKAWIDSGAWR